MVGGQFRPRRWDDAVVGVVRGRAVGGEGVTLVDKFQPSVRGVSVWHMHEQYRDGECQTRGASGLCGDKV